MTSSIMTLHLLPRKVTTLYGKQNGGSRKYQGLKMEPEFMSGEEFLRSIEARLARMEEMANAFHDYQTDHFRRELEEKQLRASIAKTNASSNKSQNNGITENDELAKLLKIYDPDRETELADVFRYREYSEELETVEEESVANYDNEDACDQEIPEFTNGTKYLDWLKHQLPYIEPFQPQDKTHYYFFRKWRKDDLKYYSEMECLDEIQNEDDEDETESNVPDLSTSSNLKPVNDETKPEFVSGRQLVEWLGRRLAYLEPFAPTDAVHFYFKRRWSREKFVACLDVLEEKETVEEKAEEQVNETPHIKPNHCLPEEIGTKFDEDACDLEFPEFINGTEYLDWLKHQLPNMEPFQSQDETHYYFSRKWRKDEFKYYSEMECLDEIENEDDEDETESNVPDLSTSSNLKPVNDETKPEFDSGRQLVKWLGRRLAYLEPFAPTDAVHHYFKRRWSREKFVACHDVLEEIVDEKAGEQVYTTSHIEPSHSFAEDEEDINVYISLMSRPMALSGFKLEKKTLEPEQDKALPVGVNNKNIVMENTMKDDVLAPGPKPEAMKTEIESIEDKIVTKNQKKRRSFLRRLFGR